MGPIKPVWAFAPHVATVFHCAWSKKGDVGLSGTSTGLVHCSSFQFVWIWTGSQLLSSDSRTSSEPLSRNHHLLRFLSDLYFLFTSICSPTSVRRFITFLTTVVVQLLRVPQILRTPETFSLGWEGATTSWCNWLEVVPEIELVILQPGCALVVPFSVAPKVARGLEWLRLDFFLCFLLSRWLLFPLFLLDVVVICWTVTDSNLSSRLLQQSFCCFSSFL